MKELSVKKSDVRAASFCSIVSWVLLASSVAIFFIFDKYRFVAVGVMIGAGIVMFRGMKILKNRCRCPGCGAGSIGNARDREYIGELSSKKDFIICPICKKKIFIR